MVAKGVGPRCFPGRPRNGAFVGRPGVSTSATCYNTNALLDAVGQIVLQFDDTSGTPELTHRYLWGPAVDQILADEVLPPPGPGEGFGGDPLSTAGEVLWALSDHLGTVRDIAYHDPTTGNTLVALHRSYDAFGRLVDEVPYAQVQQLPGAENISPELYQAAADMLFAFTGRALDTSTGLQNNLNRWYDPQLGRWLSQDPLGFTAGDANLYRYAGNRAASLADPSGLQEDKPSLGQAAWEFAKNFWGGAWLWKLIWGAPEASRAAGELAGNTAGGIAGFDETMAAQRHRWGRMAKGQFLDSDFTKRRYGYDENSSGVMQGLATGGMIWDANAGMWVRPSGPRIPGPSRSVPTKTGTVWDAIRPTQPVYEGTVIPRSFVLRTANGSVWVSGNATEHLWEYANSMMNRGVTPALVNVASQAQLASLQAAVERAIAEGIPYGRKITVGGWQLKFAAPRQAGQLPALIHAQPVPK